jgi:hypothetical protein
MQGFHFCFPVHAGWREPGDVLAVMLVCAVLWAATPLGVAFDMFDIAAYLAGAVAVVAVEPGMRHARRGKVR